MTLFQIVRAKPISKPIYGLRKTEKTEAPTILRTDNLAISNNPKPNGNSFAKSKTVFVVVANRIRFNGICVNNCSYRMKTVLIRPQQDEDIDLENKGGYGFRKSRDACEKIRYGYYMGMCTMCMGYIKIF